MTEQQYHSLTRYLAEETAHHKFCEDAVHYNSSTGEHEFTHHAEKFIRDEISNLEFLFEVYDVKPKLSLTKRIKKWLKN